MFQIIYASAASESFATDDLVELLRKARLKNRSIDVSGMLVFCNSQFLQLLEGEPGSVIETFDRVERDPRHRDVTVLSRGVVYSGRNFPDWSMGFKDVSGTAELEGFVRINNRINLKQFDHEAAIDFLLACNGGRSTANDASQ